MKHLIAVSCFGCLAAGILAAQETPTFSFSIGAGFTLPAGNSGRNLDTGWNIRGGGGVNFSPYFGTMLDLGYDRFGINGATLATSRCKTAPLALGKMGIGPTKSRQNNQILF